nr:reverse transcriptase domain-containing protein [Tanacetum cinerariifolium]
MDSYAAHMIAASKDIIENGNSIPKTQTVNDVKNVIPPTTADEKLQRRNNVKARSTLMMGLPNEHQLKFKSIKDAKSLLAAVEKSNGVNTAQGVNTANEVNTASSQVNVASASNIDNLSDAVICAFLASHPNSTKLVNEDLEQIHPNDFEEMDLKDRALTELQMRLYQAKAEKEGIQLNVNKLENGSKSLNKIIKLQIMDNGKKGLGYNAVPPPLTGLFLPQKSDLSSTGLEELFNEPKTEKSKDKSNKIEPESVKKHSDAPIFQDWVSDEEVEKQEVKPSLNRINFVKATTNNNPKETVKIGEQSKQNTHRKSGNQRNWNGMMSHSMTNEREITPPTGFSTPIPILNVSTSELPPITTSIFTATTPENTLLSYRASTSANPNPMISPDFIEANYESLEFLLRQALSYPPQAQNDRPSTYNGLMEKTYTWIKVRVVATNETPDNQKKSFKRSRKPLGTTTTKDKKAWIVSETKTPDTRGSTISTAGPLGKRNKKKEKMSDTQLGECKKGEKGTAPIEASVLMISRKVHSLKKRLVEEDHSDDLLKANADVFAWTTAHLTRVSKTIIVKGEPFNIEPRMNEFKYIEPVKQKKRSLASERNEAIHVKVEELTNTNILREFKYQTWVSNPVIVKKTDGRWKLCIDFTDMNKAFFKEHHPLPVASQKIEDLSETPSTRDKELEVEETKRKEPKPENAWKLLTNEASSSDTSGAGLMLVNPEGKEYTYAFRFKFKTTNNEAEYEAQLAGLRIATKMKIQELAIF